MQSIGRNGKNGGESKNLFPWRFTKNKRRNGAVSKTKQWGLWSPREEKFPRKGPLVTKEGRSSPGQRFGPPQREADFRSHHGGIRENTNRSPREATNSSAKGQ